MGALVGTIFLAGGCAPLALGRELLLDVARGLGVGFGHVFNDEDVDDRARAVAFDDPRSGAAEDVADRRDGQLPRGEPMRAMSVIGMVCGREGEAYRHGGCKNRRDDHDEGLGVYCSTFLGS